MSNETTTTQPGGTQETVASNEEPLSSQAEQAGELEIPAKFVGKDPQDIIRSYAELEKNFHRISSERAEATKAKAELERRLQETEARIAQTHQSANSQSRTTQQEQSDPLAEYDSQFDVDPKGAIKKALSSVASKAEQLTRQQEIAMARDYYFQRKQQDQEFAKLEATMNTLSQQYADVLSPERVNPKRALELLELAAKGATRDEYASSVKRAAEPIKDEKRAAHSESSHSDGERRIAFKDLSLEEMSKLLGRSDK